MHTKKLKVILVEDHLLVRKGVRAILESDVRFIIIGEYGDAESLLATIDQNVPDVILMDISLPGINGMQAIGEIKLKYPGIRIIVLSMFTEIEYIQQCLDYDVSGYIIKGSGSNDFLMAFDAVYNGKTYFSNEIHLKVMDSYKYKKQKKHITEQINLTEREREILKQLAEGKTNVQMAEQMFISERTVEAHRSNIMKKLNANNSAELISKAFRLGLIS